jgi:hypothetical protein
VVATEAELNNVGKEKLLPTKAELNNVGKENLLAIWKQNQVGK